MKYGEILGLNDNFHPVYDLENEVEMYWKRFVPNENFYKLLSYVLNSLDGNRPEKRKPIWLQGTYGTGKSHATSVIKHLLYDNKDDIEDFNIDNQQIKFRLESFRKEKKVFPVVLKGTSNINDNKTFALVIEKAVKDSLKRKGIRISTKTDFEKIISKLKSENNIINWDHVIEGTELEFYGSQKQIISKLEQGDITLLTKIEHILSEKEDLHFSNDSITDWLVEVKQELKEKGIADYLMIYWDEFSGIFDLPKFGLLLNELQNIAELSINKGVQLFIVSHKRPYQISVSQEDLKKILGRFEVLDYAMKSITTYQIINASINKIDKNRWLDFKNQHIEKTKFITEELTGTEGITVQNSLENLFPIHPYTAYLATFMARNIGSTERSIFNFLYDEKNGFKRFIKECPVDDKDIFLTADYLWDFFYEEFDQMDDENVHSILEKFKTNNDFLKKQGNDYLSIFKVILLLNIIYKVVEISETSLVSPSDNTIINIFAGSIDEDSIKSILNFIDDKTIISKTPDDLYVLMGSGLPPREVEIEKLKLKTQNLKIEDLLENQQDEIIDFIKNSVDREIEIKFIEANLNINQIRNKIDKTFKFDYTIHACLFLGRSDQELIQLKNTLKEIVKQSNLSNIIFVVSEVILAERDFEKYFEFKAREIVARKRNYTADEKESSEFASKIIKKWINNIKSRYITWFLDDQTGNVLMGQFSDRINKDLSKKIFSFGLENIYGTQKNRNIWKKGRSKKSIEIFLFAEKREKILENTVRYPEHNLREILKDNTGEFIIDSNLKLKENVSDYHPIKAMCLEMNRKFEDGKNQGVFNLGKQLQFLSQSPYGLYKSMISMATMGFLLNEYSGKLFEAGTGIPIEKHMMTEEILKLFDFWESGTGAGNLQVRIGSEDEKKLIDILCHIFKLEDNIQSLNSVRWEIRTWVKKEKFPIWVFKCAGVNEKTEKALDGLFNLIHSIDTELTPEVKSDYLDIIGSADYDLKVLIDNEDPKNLFEKWLMNIKNIEISSEDFEDIIKYTWTNMPEEVDMWTESDTIVKVQEWKLEKFRVADQKLKQNNTIKKQPLQYVPKVASKITPKTSGDQVVLKSESEITSGDPEILKRDSKYPHNIENPNMKNTHPNIRIPQNINRAHLNENDNSNNNIKMRIKSCNEELLKKAIIHLIEDKPEIIEFIEKYLEN